MDAVYVSVRQSFGLYFTDENDYIIQQIVFPFFSTLLNILKKLSKKIAKKRFKEIKQLLGAKRKIFYENKFENNRVQSTHFPFTMYYLLLFIFVPTSTVYDLPIS